MANHVIVSQVKNKKELVERIKQIQSLDLGIRLVNLSRLLKKLIN